MLTKYNMNILLSWTSQPQKSVTLQPQPEVGEHLVALEKKTILKFPRLFSVSKKNMDFYAYMLEELGIEMGVIINVGGKRFFNFLRMVRHLTAKSSHFIAQG